VVLPEVAARSGFGRRLLMVLANVNHVMLVGRRWRRGGHDRLYVHLLATGAKPLQLGYVDLERGLVRPTSPEPVAHRKRPASQLIEYAWAGYADGSRLAGEVALLAGGLYAARESPSTGPRSGTPNGCSSISPRLTPSP
jgi:hypothetical protein